MKELTRIEELCASGFGRLARIQELGRVRAGGRDLPILALTIGSEDRQLPTLGLFGGVHGLEQIGSHTVLAFLESLASQCQWDRDLQAWFESARLVTIPIVNPGGFLLGTRSNPNGVDLMRNSPVEATQGATWLIGGHRFSARLPWYRGDRFAPMEYEAQVLGDFVRAELFPSRAAIALDVHSGFGTVDRLWYPFARSKEPFPRLRQVEALKHLLDSTNPHHIYHFEPQSRVYTTHGDLWDYFFDQHALQEDAEQRPFLPLTLEMGSWLWVKKNPLQAMSSLGIFNPIKPHRYSRTMRRHLPLLNFLFRATRNPEAWASGATTKI